MLIWDTGTYTILPRRSKHEPLSDPSSLISNGSPDPPQPSDEPEKLHQAFQDRKIHLRLHGTRLPQNYTVNLRLSHGSHSAQPKAPRRRRTGLRGRKAAPQETPESSDAEAKSVALDLGDDVISAPSSPHVNQSAIEKEMQEREDEEMRRTNAYPGATNTIGSVHQRKWFLSLDRLGSGFVKVRREGGGVVWERGRVGVEDEGGELGGFEPFFVRGRDFEKSVVTGRVANEVMRHEGVVGFLGRKGWRPVLE
jgi:hypothetical protein